MVKVKESRDQLAPGLVSLGPQIPGNPRGPRLCIPTLITTDHKKSTEEPTPLIGPANEYLCISRCRTMLTCADNIIHCTYTSLMYAYVTDVHIRHWRTHTSLMYAYATDVNYDWFFAWINIISNDYDEARREIGLFSSDWTFFGTHPRTPIANYRLVFSNYLFMESWCYRQQLSSIFDIHILFFASSACLDINWMSCIVSSPVHLH